jgi:hypothetical protein
LRQARTQADENPTTTQIQFRGALAQNLSPLGAKSRSVAHLEHDAVQLHGRMESNLLEGRLRAVHSLSEPSVNEVYERSRKINHRERSRGRSL